MKHRSLNIVFITCFTWLAVFTTPSLHAFLASVKSAGMGLTGVANPQDALAAAYNPAGAVEVGDRVDVGVSWDHYTGSATVHGNLNPIVNRKYEGTHKRDFFTPDFGINKNFCFCDLEFAVGVVAYNRDFVKTSYKEILPLLSTTSKPGLEVIREEISPYFAVKFDPSLWCSCDSQWLGTHSLGVSVNIIGQRFRVKGVNNFDNVAFSSSPGNVTNRDYDYKYGVGATIGWRGSWCDNMFALGVAYTPKTSISRHKSFKGFLAEHGRLDAPERVLAGLAITPICCTTIAFDYEHIDWAGIRDLDNKFVLIPATPPDVGIANKLGLNDGLGFGWRSQNIYRVGFDFQALESLTLRLGYRYGKTSIVATQTAPNLLLLETIQDYVTCGASWQFCSFELSGFYAHGIQHKIRGRNSIPASLGLGEVDLQEVRNVVGLSLGYCY